MGYNVSVIIPVYNAGKYVGQCLDSLLAQKEESMEIICVNDGSCDNTETVLNDYKLRDKRIKVIWQENKGAGAARNLGLSLACGKYTIFLDADDIFEKDMISDMFVCARVNNADTVICLADSFSDVTGKTAAGWTMPVELLNGQFVFSPYEKRDRLFQLVQGWPWDKMFRTEYIKKLGISYPDLPNSQDLVFVFQALVFSKRIAVVNEVLVHRRIHNACSISNSRALCMDAPFRAVEQVLSSFERRGVLSDYKLSFYKWVLGFWMWHLDTLPDMARKECYIRMKREWFPQMRFCQFPKEVYQGFLYRRFVLIRILPYCIYNALKKLKKGINGNGKNKAK